MSDLPSESLTYRTAVAEYFVALRGSGLLLSPLDEAQVAEWERRGLPIAVVCRGLRRGFEEHLRAKPANAPPPRSLRACRGAVEAEWRGYASGSVGLAPPPPAEADAAAARLSAARRFLDDAARACPPRLRGAYAAAAGALASASAGAPSLDAVESAIAAADAALLRAWLGALSPAERAALGPRIALRAGCRPARVRRPAFRETLRAHLADAAREAGLLRLRGSV
jgi:hypothetical protein